MTEMIETIRVAASTNAAGLAGSILKSLNKGNKCELICIGAGAVNQAAKAIAIARQMVATSGDDLVNKIGWVDIDLPDNAEKPKVSGLRFICWTV